jgi:hypothetical protein
MIIHDDKNARVYELLTLNAGTVFTGTVATHTTTPGLAPTGAVIGPIEDQAVRITIHGVDPVVATKIGHLLAVGDMLILSNTNNVVNFRAVRESATTAYIPITYLY